MLEAGLHLAVDHDGAVRHHLKAGVLEEGGVGANAQRHHNDVCLDLAIRHADTLRLGFAEHRFQAGVQANLDSLALQMTSGIVGHVFIKARHDLVGHVDDGDREALLHQVFRNLQADKAAAGNNRALGSGLLQIFPKLDGVLRGAHGEDARQRNARQRRHNGGSAAGDDAFVIVVVFLHAGAQIVGSQLLFLRVQGGDLPLHQHLSAGEGGEFRRCIDDQILLFRNQPADIVRQSATRVGDVLSLGQNGDVRSRIEAFELRRSLGSGSYAANNQYFHQLTSLSFHKRSHEQRHKVLFSFLLFYYTMFLGGMVGLRETFPEKFFAKKAVFPSL